MIIQKRILAASLLLAILFQSFSSILAVQNVTGVTCGRSDDVLKIGVFQQQLVADVFKGNFVGFDILLYCEIAKILGKTPQFQFVNSPDDMIDMLNSGELDLAGGTDLYITTSRLDKVGMVALDTSHELYISTNALVFNQATPLADTIQGVLAINPDARFGYSPGGSGSVQQITLQNAGVPSGQQINLTGTPLFSSQDYIDAFSKHNLTAIYQGTTCEILAATNALPVDYSCVNAPLASNVQAYGAGVMINKNCCGLWLKVQNAINEITRKGLYDKLITYLIDSPYGQYMIQSVYGAYTFGGAGNPNSIGAAWIPQPYSNFSLGFVLNDGSTLYPSSCSAPSIASSVDGKANALVNALRAKYCQLFCSYPVPVVD
jgi:Bacterial extracellular solute-binding proteins, family 3